MGAVRQRTLRGRAGRLAPRYFGVPDRRALRILTWPLRAMCLRAFRLDAKLRRCAGPPRAEDFGFRAQVDVSNGT
jgi:hypothetical protein